MPIYEYICRSCSHEIERLQKLSDAPLRDCPECGRAELVRKVSAPSFRLKGSGWYETDFKSDKDKKRNLAGDVAKPEAKPESRPEGKTEAKPESKAAGKSETKPESKPAAKPAESKPAASPSSKAGPT